MLKVFCVLNNKSCTNFDDDKNLTEHYFVSGTILNALFISSASVSGVLAIPAPL